MYTYGITYLHGRTGEALEFICKSSTYEEAREKISNFLQSPRYNINHSSVSNNFTLSSKGDVIPLEHIILPDYEDEFFCAEEYELEGGKRLFFLEAMDSCAPSNPVIVNEEMEIMYDEFISYEDFLLHIGKEDYGYGSEYYNHNEDDYNCGDESEYDSVEVTAYI